MPTSGKERRGHPSGCTRNEPDNMMAIIFSTMQLFENCHAPAAIGQLRGNQVMVGDTVVELRNSLSSTRRRMDLFVQYCDPGLDRGLACHHWMSHGQIQQRIFDSR